jgi:hypothetical protein
MGEEDGLEDEGDRVASNDKQGKKGGRLPQTLNCCSDNPGSACRADHEVQSRVTKVLYDNRRDGG